MKDSFAIIAALLAVVGNVPYSISIIRGTVKPHAYTWFVWSLVTGIVLVGQIQKGAGVGAIPTAVAEVFTLINFGLALKYGYRKVTTSDAVFFGIALLGIIPWLLTNDPTISVVLAVSIDLIAFVPTLRKAWVDPETDRPILFTMNVARHILALFALQAYNVATVLHSAAMIITNTLMAAILIIRTRTKPPENG